MKKAFLALIAAASFAAPAAIDVAPAAAYTSYPCSGNVWTDYNCTRVDVYYCDGYRFDAYRFWQHIYNLTTGQVVSTYKETYVNQRSTSGKYLWEYYFGGWGSPC